MNTSEENDIQIKLCELNVSNTQIENHILCGMNAWMLTTLMDSYKSIYHHQAVVSTITACLFRICTHSLFSISNVSNSICFNNIIKTFDATHFDAKHFNGNHQWCGVNLENAYVQIWYMYERLACMCVWHKTKYEKEKKTDDRENLWSVRWVNVRSRFLFRWLC